MGERCRPRSSGLPFAVAPASGCRFGVRPQCRGFLEPGTCHVGRQRRAMPRRRRPRGPWPHTLEIYNAEPARLVFVTVASVSTQDSNPLVWIANGVGSVTATAWTVLVERSLSIWRPGADENGESFGGSASDRTNKKRSSRNRPSPAGEDDVPAATQFIDLFGSQVSERDDDGLAERLIARRGDSRADSVGCDRATTKSGSGPQRGKRAHLEPTLRAPKSRGGLFTMGRERDDRSGRRRSPSQESARRGEGLSYGGLAQSRIFALVNEALDRPVDGPLDTMLPYDMQRALFHELRSARRSKPVTKPVSISVEQMGKSRPRSEPVVAIPLEPLQIAGAPAPLGVPAANSLSSDSGLLLDQVQRAIEDFGLGKLNKQASNKKNARSGDQAHSLENESRNGNGSPWGWLFFWNRTDQPKSSVEYERSKAPSSKGIRSGPLYPPAVEDVAKAIADSRMSQNDLSAPPTRSKSSTDKNSRSNKELAKSQSGESSDVGGALNVPLRMVGELLRAVSWVRGQDEGIKDEIDLRSSGDSISAYAAAMTRDVSAMDDSDPGGKGAASAFAAASAIASKSRSSQLDAIEVAGLQASVTAARAVKTIEDAEVFVGTVGAEALVKAVRVLPGRPRSAALTALANIAIMLPGSRVDMLTKDSGSLLGSLAQTLQHSDRLGSLVSSMVDRDAALCHMEALVSGTHLLGSLALARGRTGAESRRRMAHDADIIRILQRLAGGSKNGEPEGAARAARRALGAIGINTWMPRLPGQRGLRILSIDGGGTRAIMAFETLKYLEKITGSRVQDMFDIIGGTSTGAIVAASLGIAHKSVNEVEALYRRLIGKIFAKHPVNGPKMLLTRAYYDTRVLEETLKEECGTGVFIDSLAEERMNKVFVVSSIMSRSPQELHVFRNYTYPLGHESRYDGTCEAQLWEALRASSAAPTFFSEIRVNGELHADGAIVANNPTAVALHEAKCMYPGVPIEVVVSIGNGLSAADVAAVQAASHDRPHGAGEGEEKMKAVGWGDVVGSIVASATSTEHVHHALSDLFPESKYFRFNPETLSNEIDETRPEKLADFVRDARKHIELNRERFAEVARALRPKTTKSMWLRFRDAVSEEITALAAIEDDVYLL